MRSIQKRSWGRLAAVSVVLAASTAMAPSTAWARDASAPNIASSTAANAVEASALYKNASAPMEQRIEDLLARMTLEEKVAQMRIFHARRGHSLGAERKGADAQR